MPAPAVTERAGTGPLVITAPAFVGRDLELAALTRTLASPPAVVLVEGKPGIGKSRLIREYLATSAGKAQCALMACCPPFREPHTLAPVADALRQAAEGGLRGLDPSAAAGALRPLFPAAFLHQHTEGVPLAVEELVRLMANRADPARRSRQWVRRHLPDIDVPPTIRDAVLDRVGRLPADVCLRKVIGDPGRSCL